MRRLPGISALPQSSGTCSRAGGLWWIGDAVGADPERPATAHTAMVDATSAQTTSMMARRPEKRNTERPIGSGCAAVTMLSTPAQTRSRNSDNLPRDLATFPTGLACRRDVESEGPTKGRGDRVRPIRLGRSARPEMPVECCCTARCDAPAIAAALESAINTTLHAQEQSCALARGVVASPGGEFSGPERRAPLLALWGALIVSGLETVALALAALGLEEIVSTGVRAGAGRICLV